MKMVIKGKVAAGLGLDKHSTMPQPWKCRVLGLATPTHRGGKVPASKARENPAGGGPRTEPQEGSSVISPMQ